MKYRIENWNTQMAKEIEADEMRVQEGHALFFRQVKSSEHSGSLYAMKDELIGAVCLASCVVTACKLPSEPPPTWSAPEDQT